MLELKNHFVRCLGCRRYLRFDYLDQVRECECGRYVEISDQSKRSLLEEYQFWWCEEKDNPRFPMQFVTYQSTPRDSITFGRSSSISIHSNPDYVVSFAGDVFILVRGRLRRTNIHKETMEAFTTFFMKHKDALRRLT